MDVISHLTEKCTSLLIFEISDVEYCLSNTIQYTIAKAKNLFKMGDENTSKYSLLLIDNKSIPIINLKKIFNNITQQVDDNSRIIILDYKDIQFGLLVERISEIIAVDSKFMAASMQFIPEENGGYTEGTLEFENRKLMLLDIEKIVSEISI